jgi:hypothetical protein
MSRFGSNRAGSRAANLAANVRNAPPPDVRGRALRGSARRPDVRAPLVAARVWVPPIVIKAGYIRREAQHGRWGGSRQGGHLRRTDQASGGWCGRSDCASILAHGRDDRRSDCESIPPRARAPAQADCSYGSEHWPYCQSRAARLRPKALRGMKRTPVRSLPTPVDLAQEGGLRRVEVARRL